MMRARIIEHLRERATRRAGDACVARIEGRHFDTIVPLFDASLCAFACAALGAKPPIANDDGHP